MFIVIAATLRALDAVWNSDAWDPTYLRKILLYGTSGYEHFPKVDGLTFLLLTVVRKFSKWQQQLKICQGNENVSCFFVCTLEAASGIVNKIVVHCCCCCCCLHVFCGLLNLNFNWVLIFISRWKNLLKISIFGKMNCLCHKRETTGKFLSYQSV